MLSVKALDEVAEEAGRFLIKVKEARERISMDIYSKYGCKETGAVRRASMDLTRALVEMRKP